VSEEEVFDQRPRTHHEAKQEQQLSEIEALLRPNLIAAENTAARVERIERIERAQEGAAAIAIEARDSIFEMRARFDTAEEQREEVIAELSRNTEELRKLKRRVWEVRKVASTTGASVEQLRDRFFEEFDDAGKRLKDLENATGTVRRRVLVVDDEPDQRDMYERVLGQIPDAQIITAKNGLHALQLLRAHDIDLLITDHLMPGLIGEDLLILAKERYPRMRRVLVTGNYDPGLVRDAQAHEVLIKPVSLDVLQRIARRELRRARSDE